MYLSKGMTWPIELEIAASRTVEIMAAPGAKMPLVLDAKRSSQHVGRHFSIASTGTLKLKGFELTGGYQTSSSTSSWGGSVYNLGKLVGEQVNFKGNRAYVR
jgi:hypothetical protein